MAREFLAGLIWPATGEAPAVGRALHRRRHVDRRLGPMKSFRPKDGSGEPRGRAATGALLAEVALLQRDPRVDHRSGRPALPQGRWPEQPVVLHGPFPDGEPERAGGRCRADPRHRQGRAGGDPDDARPPRGRRRITLAADKAYDVTDFVGELRARRVTPHIAVNGAISKTGKRRRSAIDGRTTRHPG